MLYKNEKNKSLLSNSIDVYTSIIQLEKEKRNTVSDDVLRAAGREGLNAISSAGRV